MSVILEKEDGAPSPHLFRSYGSNAVYSSGLFGVFRPGAAGLAHLLYMDTTTTPSTDPGRTQLQLIEQCLSLSELCAHLQVSVQTIYDLRSQGRGPRGFRVSREVRFRVSEIEAWLARME
ncbi:MAG: helix-turn-helix domain-containing protein [Ornithinimicrobium sp.]